MSIQSISMLYSDNKVSFKMDINPIFTQKKTMHYENKFFFPLFVFASCKFSQGFLHLSK